MAWISKILKEGEAVPFGYGFVRHRIDYISKEVAPLPINYLIRWLYRWQQKSYVSMTREELRALKAVRALMIEAELKGNIKGRDWATRQFMEAAASPSKEANLDKDTK